MPMITGAVAGNVVPKHGSIIVKTPGKEGSVVFQEINTYVSNIPTLANVDAKLDGKFDNALYYTNPTGAY